MNSTLNPNYISGFVDGEGCFSITINKRDRRIPEVRLLFEIELEEADADILNRIKVTIGCGNIYYLTYKKHPNWNKHVKLKVSNFSDIYGKIIPFFTKYPLQAKKRFQFERFCKVAKMIKEKKHLDITFIKEIIRIKEGL